jgi:CO dehydrogenase maturation factor
VIDNAAGMEHISRRTMSAIDKLMLVSDYSVSGIRSTRRILDLANEMKIKIGGAWLIVNKVDGPLSALKDEIAKTRIEMAGELPYSDALVRWNISGGPTLGFGGRDIKDRMGCIFGRMTEKKDGDRACKRKI